MNRKIKEITRNRRLTDGEAAKYREVRALVAAELPELRARARARLRESREAPWVMLQST
jgi:hypothetical protein